MPFQRFPPVETREGATVELFESDKTGMRVLKVDTEGPMVNLFGVIATEAVTNEWQHKDDGLPHTLEHLIFLGSEDFPYKGVLDKLANRCLAQGTNAWTATDHTAYTVTTAGSEGFLNILPIFVDHILRPTITDEGYMTEIYHVTGEGEDKGVVYCEMQGRENSSWSVVQQASVDVLYPGDDCGYSSETGGKMSNLRDSVDAAKIRQYHKEFYRADNLCIMVTGSVDSDKLVQVLQKWEDQHPEPPAIHRLSPDTPYQRPWMRPSLCTLYRQRDYLVASRWCRAEDNEQTHHPHICTAIIDHTRKMNIRNTSV